MIAAIVDGYGPGKAVIANIENGHWWDKDPRWDCSMEQVAGQVYNLKLTGFVGRQW